MISQGASQALGSACDSADQMVLRGHAIALLIIGEPFRSPTTREPCTSASIAAQHEASRSYLENVAQPLRSNGNHVDIFLTLPQCADDQFASLMLEWFPEATRTFVESTSMAHGWRAGYYLVHQHMKTHNVTYDFVLQGRHDIMVADSILSWPSMKHNYTKLLFESEGRECRGGCNMGSDIAEIIRDCGPGAPKCSADQFFWAPKRFFHKLFYIATHPDTNYKQWGHGFLHNFRESDYSYLFPDCKQFQSLHSCDTLKLYRPEDRGSRQRRRSRRRFRL